MKRMFLIKRKGYNHYADYAELYMHKTFENKGYYLVLDESKCLFNVIFDISEEKYMAAFSPYFDNLSEEDAQEFAEILSVNFKSEVITVPFFEDYQFKGIPYICMFSDTYNAFEEDPYVYNKKPEFDRKSWSCHCISNESYFEDYVNYGGEFKGLEISISFNTDDVEIENTFLAYELNKKGEHIQLSFEKKDDRFVCILNDFGMAKGINKYSAVLRGKKLFNAETKHSFSIYFTPKSNTYQLVPEISIKPLQCTGN